MEEVRLSSTTAVHLFKWATPALAFAAVLAVLLLVNRSGPEPLSGTPASTGDVNQAPPQDTESLIAGLQAAVKADPADASGYALLGEAYYQRARETGDPAYYSRAEGSFNAALNRDPNELTATLGKGTLALARHDFQAGLDLAQRARRLAPDLVRPYAVLADAQIELGRYAAAAGSLERMAALKPTLATYSRISYYRELDGDLGGAARRCGWPSRPAAAAPKAPPTFSRCSGTSSSIAADTRPPSAPIARRSRSSPPIRPPRWGSRSSMPAGGASRPRSAATGRSWRESRCPSTRSGSPKRSRRRAG